jgi:hypothetical protein
MDQQDYKLTHRRTTNELETETSSTPDTKRVLVYGWDGTAKERLAVDTSGKLVTSSLVPFAYDYIKLSYVGTNLTSAEYYTSGSGGTKVATLTLAYTGSQLDTVART